MNDTQEVDSGAGESTNPPVSQSIESAPKQSQEFLELKKALEQTQSELKGLQSRQDKETNEVQRFMGEIKKRVASGMSLDEAEKSVTADQKSAEKDALLYEIAKKVGVTGSPPANSAGNGNPPATDKASLLAEYGLSENDPDVVSALLSEKDVEKAALKVAFKRSQKQSDPAAAPATSASTHATDQSDLQAQYDKTIRNAKAKGKLTPMQVADIKAEYRRKGLDIW